MVSVLYISSPPLYPEVIRGYDLLSQVCTYPSLYCSIECYQSALPVTVLLDGIISRLEVLACSPPAIQRFDLDSCIHFLCLYVICFES